LANITVNDKLTISICRIIASEARSVMLPTNTVIDGSLSAPFS